MIARGFKPVAWVGAIGTAALGCYMLSLQVAAERAELASLEGQILRARQDIRSLQTELGTRGRLQQLEQWNSEVLALSAPVSGQFLESGLTLARFDTRETPQAVHDNVRLASAETAPQPAAPAQPPRLIQASAELPAEPARTAAVRRAALQVPAAAPRGSKSAPAPTVRRAGLDAAATASRPAVTQVRASSLLDERTLRELNAAAREEGGDDE